MAIVSQSAAEAFWPGEDAVGKNVIARFGSPTVPDSVRSVTFLIVGIVGDVRVSGPGASALYVPLQRYVSTVSIIAGRSGDRSLAGTMTSAIAATDPNLPVLSAQSLESQLSGPVETQLRIAATVAGSVGLVGLLLAAIGIYGVTAYAVTRRTREIGIRLALVASRGEVVGLVLRQSMTLVTIGSVIGLVLGLGAGRVLAASPFRTPSVDPIVFAGAAVLFAAVGLLACYVPVRRATRINAMEALRYE